MPCAFDQRPLRVTLFPDHPQTILIYVPEGQALWLPTLPSPFDLDAVCDVLDAHDVPHDTREGDRNRWWRNLKQSEDDDKASLKNHRREEDAAHHVRIQLSPTSTTLEKQRSEVLLMMHKVDDEIRQLKVQISRARAAATRGVYERPGVFRQWQQRLADLQTTSLALQRKSRELKEQQRQHQHQQSMVTLEEQRRLKAQRRQQRIQEHEQRERVREQRFIHKVKRQLTREQFLAIWTEIDAEDAATHEQGAAP